MFLLNLKKETAESKVVKFETKELTDHPQLFRYICLTWI